MPPPGPDLLRVRNLRFRHEGRAEDTLADVSFEVPRGALVGMVGRAGSGKSTVLGVLAGLGPGLVGGSWSGAIERAAGSAPEARLARPGPRDVGIVLQDFDAQLLASTAALEIAFPLENAALPRDVIQERVDRYLTLAGLETQRERDPLHLSGGQRQRLAVASILGLEPELLLLDEPLTDADASAQGRVMALVGTLVRDGRSVIIAEHETDSLVGCDLVLVLDRGRVVATGTAQEVLTRPELLLSAGVRPPQLVQLGHEVGWGTPPLTVAQAYDLIRPRTRRPSSQQEASAGPVRGRPVIELERATYRYSSSGGTPVGPISLTVRTGECVALLGANGSGKTTVAKLMAGIVRPTQGHVWLDGVHAEQPRPAVARVVGFTYQNPDHQIYAQTVAQEVESGPRNLGLRGEQLAGRVDQALSAVGLRGYEQRDPFSLTKGERQRVAVASTLAMGSKVLVLDEPTTGLDHGQQQSLVRMLASMLRSGFTVVITTHTTRIAVELASRVIVLETGRVVLDGEPSAVLADEERLRTIGVTVPPVVELAHLLGSRALTIPTLAAELLDGTGSNAQSRPLKAMP